VSFVSFPHILPCKRQDWRRWQKPLSNSCSPLDFFYSLHFSLFSLILLSIFSISRNKYETFREREIKTIKKYNSKERKINQKSPFLFLNILNVKPTFIDTMFSLKFSRKAASYHNSEAIENLAIMMV